MLSDFALMSTDVRENSSYIKSFAVDKLLAAAAPKLQRLQSIAYQLVSTWRLIGGGGGWRQFRGLLLFSKSVKQQQPQLSCSVQYGTDGIPVSCDCLPVKSIAKAFGQVRLPAMRVSRAGLTTDER